MLQAFGERPQTGGHNRQAAVQRAGQRVGKTFRHLRWKKHHIRTLNGDPRGQIFIAVAAGGIQRQRAMFRKRRGGRADDAKVHGQLPLKGKLCAIDHHIQSLAGRHASQARHFDAWHGSSGVRQRMRPQCQRHLWMDGGNLPAQIFRRHINAVCELQQLARRRAPRCGLCGIPHHPARGKMVLRRQRPVIVQGDVIGHPQFACQ